MYFLAIFLYHFFFIIKAEKHRCVIKIIDRWSLHISVITFFIQIRLTIIISIKELQKQTQNAKT